MYPAWDSKTKDSNGRPNKPRHEKWFYAWLIGLSTLGGFWALFLPLALNQKFDGPNADGNQLRLHLLYITGGVLALITLGETHRKNTVDREKAKVEKNNYEKSQTHQDNVLEEQQRQFNETIAKERERIEVEKAKRLKQTQGDWEHERTVAERAALKAEGQMVTELRITDELYTGTAEKITVRARLSLVVADDKFALNLRLVGEEKHNRAKAQEMRAMAENALQMPVYNGQYDSK